MTELRWVLLLIALIVLLGLFVWPRIRQKLPVSRLPPARRDPVLAEPSGARQGPTAHSPADPPALPDKIVTIRVMARAGNPFRGEDLVMALRAAGLRHGQHSIFHSYAGDGDENPVFSVAGLTNPGSFDLTRLHTDVFPGITLFLGLPGPVDGVAAFEAMVSAARAVAAKLDGNLVDEHGSTLSVQRERYLREEVIQFQHQRGKPA